MSNHKAHCRLGGANPAAYCRKHKCCMTVRQIKNRECLNKQCGALSPLEHPYWEHREYIKQKKKEKKESVA